MGRLNKFLVGVLGERVVIMGKVSGRALTYDDALLLAAYLVVLAEPFASEKFADVLKDVKNS